MLLLTLRETYALNRLSSFKNLRRKGRKFDHRPGRPKVLLRHWQDQQPYKRYVILHRRSCTLLVWKQICTKLQ